MFQNLLIILFLDKKIDKPPSDRTLLDPKLIVLLLPTTLLLIHIAHKSNKMKTLRLLQENRGDPPIPITLSDPSPESIGNILIVQSYKAEKEPIGKNQPELEPRYPLHLLNSNLLVDLIILS